MYQYHHPILIPNNTDQYRQTAVIQNENGSFKDHLKLNVGDDHRICHFNIEGISKTKSEVLTNIMNKERVNIIALQETHTEDDNNLQKRGYITGYMLIGTIHHKQYGITMYVKKNIDDTRVIHKDNSENILEKHNRKCNSNVRV